MKSRDSYMSGYIVEDFFDIFLFMWFYYFMKLNALES